MHRPGPRLVATLFLALAALLSSVTVSAQDLPSASVLATATSDGVRTGFAGPVDRIVRARLDALGVVRVHGSVALDIADVQLALGCVGETPECLGQAAQQIGVDILILPNLDRAGGDLVLSIARFDAASGALRRAVRHARGEDAETEILETVEPALRELFDLPPPEPEQVARAVQTNATGDDAQHASPAGATPDEEPARDDADAEVVAAGPDLTLPIVSLGVGGAALVAGIVTGVLFATERDAYAVPPQTVQDVADRASHRSNAESLALATDVLLAVGGAVTVAGVAWLALTLFAGGDHAAPEDRVTLTPILGPRVAGLSLRGMLPESL